MDMTADILPTRDVQEDIAAQARLAARALRTDKIREAAETLKTAQAIEAAQPIALFDHALTFFGSDLSKHTPELQKMIAFIYFNAAEHDHAPALYAYGLCRLNGTGVEKNEAIAVQYFAAGAAQLDPKAINAWGACQESGVGTPKDDVQAMVKYAWAAELGYAPAIKNFLDLTKQMEAAQKAERQATTERLWWRRNKVAANKTL